MTDEEVQVEPEVKFSHYMRRNNVMLAVNENGKITTHEVCKSINSAKAMSRQLQKSGKKVVVDHEASNRFDPAKAPKVYRKKKKPLLTEDDKAVVRMIIGGLNH